MTHENEYGDQVVKLLELIWGKGYMAPGGPGNVARLLRELDTRGRRVLDVGSGLGGPALEMVTTHGADVTGIDLEAPLVERANAEAAAAGISDRCRFRPVEVGSLPFADASFDIVVSSGALTQTEDKAGTFAEIRRVLEPGGWFTCYDWMRAGDEYSDDMRYFFELEGLTYAMETLEGQAQLLRDAGFASVESEDATDWYRHQSRQEYDRLKGELYPAMVETLGRAGADKNVENWRAMVVVIDKGEMRQCYCRGKKPTKESPAETGATT